MSSPNAGVLTLVPTPLNEDDLLDSESLKRLQEAIQNPLTLIVAEEAKVARQRWIRWGLPREQINNFLYLNEHNAKELTKDLGQKLLEGFHLFLMSDGGMPAFCDPGQELVNWAHIHQIKVTCFPIANSVIATVALSGFPARRFIFEGFGPREEELRKRWIQKIAQSQDLCLIMDTPYRLQKLLSALQQAKLSRPLFLAINLFSPNELFLRGTIEKVIEKTQHLSKEEFVLAIAGKIDGRP